jgi:hypothetical protein
MPHGLPIGLHTTNMTLLKTTQNTQITHRNFFFTQGHLGHFRPISPYGMPYGLPIRLRTTNMILLKTTQNTQKTHRNILFHPRSFGSFSAQCTLWDAPWTSHWTPYDKHDPIQNISNTPKTHGKLVFRSSEFGSFLTHRPLMGCPLDFP